jgi:hypothetical protein
MGTDMTAQQCGISDRQTYMVSSVLHSGLYINTLLSRCKETWAGDVWRGGGVAGSPWPVKDFKPVPSVQ